MSTTDAGRPADLPDRVEIYDTTLRDGSQLEGISLTVDDKLRIAEQLDWLGVDFIEAGWPGANPKDDELFQRAKSELRLETSTLVAFGMTRRAKGKVDSDDTLRHLIDADTSTVCIVGKCWDYHVLEALDTTLDEGVAMVADSIAYLKELGRDVLFDAEHFFDGYRSNPEFSLRVLEGAVQAGVDRLVLCDTNGGSLPADVEETVRGVVDYLGPDVAIGVHLHDDAGCGVANALAGVRGGATQVQGTINGYGERTGNCTRFVMSELAGKSTIVLKAQELGIELDGPTINEVVDTLKHLEHEGYHFEVADASLELLMRRASGWQQDYFRVESFRVITDDLAADETPGGVTTEATIKVHVGGERLIATAEGNGPINALDRALRDALDGRYPALDRVHLTDYKVRVLDTQRGTGAVTRVLLDTTDGEESWTTIGVSENIIEASWQALSDSLVYGLLRATARA